MLLLYFGSNTWYESQYIHQHSYDLVPPQNIDRTMNSPIKFIIKLKLREDVNITSVYF